MSGPARPDDDPPAAGRAWAARDGGLLLVLDSVAALRLTDEDAIVIAGSHAAVAAARHAARYRPFALLLHDAGSDAGGPGTGGLAVLDAMGIVAAAVAAGSARIGDGFDLLHAGRLSVCGVEAGRAGLRPGDRVAEAADRLLALRDSRVPTRIALARDGVVVCDSISLLGGRHRGLVVVCGSHAGASTVAAAGVHGPAAVIANDAGIGKDEAGIAALPLWAERGVPAAAVSAASAAIGDGADTLRRGVLSAVNAPAAELGLRPGQTAAEAVERLLEHVVDGTKQRTRGG